jgi:hypothetical protein
VSPLCFLLLQNLGAMAMVCFLCWISQTGWPVLLLLFVMADEVRKGKPKKEGDE